MKIQELQLTAGKVEVQVKLAIRAAKQQDWKTVRRAGARISATLVTVRQEMQGIAAGDVALIPEYRRILVAQATIATLVGAGTIGAHVAEARVAHLDCFYGEPTEDTLVGIRARAFLFRELAKLAVKLPDAEEDIKTRLKQYLAMAGEELRFLVTAIERVKSGEIRVLPPKPLKGEAVRPTLTLPEQLTACRAEVEGFYNELDAIVRAGIPKMIVS